MCASLALQSLALSHDVIFASHSKGYYHMSFIRGRLDLATTIQPGKIKGKRGRRPKNDETEPNFYQMPSSSDVQLPAEVQTASPATSSKPVVEPTATPMAATTIQEMKFSPKDDSPDQHPLEAIMHQPQYRAEIFENRQSELAAHLGTSQFPSIPVQQSLAAESRPISMAPAAAPQDEGNLQVDELLFPQFASNVVPHDLTRQESQQTV